MCDAGVMVMNVPRHLYHEIYSLILPDIQQQAQITLTPH